MLCSYGCGKEAKHQLKNGKWCCSKSANSCEINKTKNANGQIGRKHTELEKIKMSISMMGKNKGKPSPMLGKHHSEDTIKKLRRNFTEEHKRNLSNAHKGKLGFKPSNETKEKIRQRNIGKKRSQECKDKISKMNKGRKRSEEFKEKRRQIMLNGGSKYVSSFPKHLSQEGRESLRRKMLNGQSLKMIKAIKKISNEEIRLRNMVKELYSNCEFQYPVLNYSLDVALLNEKIAIEYDGYYHFDTTEHKEYHKLRQEKIEKEGWKFLRYTMFDKFPSLEKLKNDLSNLERKKTSRSN